MSNPFCNYIAGQWVECKSGKTFPNINPANTTETIGEFQASGAEDVQAACDAAAKAQPAWSTAPAPRGASICSRRRNSWKAVSRKSVKR